MKSILVFEEKQKKKTRDKSRRDPTQRPKSVEAIEVDEE